MTEESEEIAFILHDCIVNGDYIIIHSESTDLYRSAVRTMKAYTLIVPRGNTYDITEKGVEVHKTIGGFDAWVADNKKRADELHQATLDSAKATVDAATSAKWSKYAAFVAAVAATSAIAIPFFQAAKPGSAVTELTTKVEKIDSLLRARPQLQKQTLSSVSSSTLPSSSH